MKTILSWSPNPDSKKNQLLGYNVLPQLSPTYSHYVLLAGADKWELPRPHTTSQKIYQQCFFSNLQTLWAFVPAWWWAAVHLNSNHVGGLFNLQNRPAGAVVGGRLVTGQHTLMFTPGCCQEWPHSCAFDHWADQLEQSGVKYPV